MNSKLFAIVLGFIALFSIANGSVTPSIATKVLRFKRGLTEDADRILRQSSSIDTNNVGQLVDLVERNRAEECLARVICELSHDTRVYGDGGSRFAQSLLRFRQSKHPKIKQYTDAMAAGARSKSNEQCKSHYPRCSHSTIEVITVARII